MRGYTVARHFSNSTGRRRSTTSATNFSKRRPLERRHYVFHADRDVTYQIRYDQPIVEIDEAFGSLLGTSTMSWGHWLADYIPKYIFAVLSGHMPRVPVLIDAGMPETHRQALELVMPEGTDIVEISPESEVRVRRLWWAPSLGYAPLLPHFNAKFSRDKFCTVPARWTSILTELGRAVDLLPRTEASTERLYLSRKPYRWTNCSTERRLSRSRGREAFRSSTPRIMRCENSRNTFAMPATSSVPLDRKWSTRTSRGPARACAT